MGLIAKSPVRQHFSLKPEKRMDYIIYHPKREEIEIDNFKVYCDSFENNQDPYIWNKKFLHSFCHITQISVKEGDTIFWVTNQNSKKEDIIYCDLIFVIGEKIYWEKEITNNIKSSNSIVENHKIFEHHYKWVNRPYNQHHFKRRRRYTLKSNPERSFQPLEKNNKLIEFYPILNKIGLCKESIINKMFKTKNGKNAINTYPFHLENKMAKLLYKEIYIKAQRE